MKNILAMLKDDDKILQHNNMIDINQSLYLLKLNFTNNFEL